MWDVKKMIQMNYFTETDSQTLKKKLTVTKGERAEGQSR